MVIASVAEDPRVNEEIDAPKVRLVGPEGDQIGIKSIREAMEIANQEGLDLVEMARNETPPVCRVMDFRKHKYELAQREKESRKKRAIVVMKEIKYRPKIGQGDLNTKTKKVREFLEGGYRVKATVMFRGREVQHPEQGRRILENVGEATEDVGHIEIQPKMEGRTMTMILFPHTNNSKQSNNSNNKVQKKPNNPIN